MSFNKFSVHSADEKEKYDPQGFRDSVLQGLDKAGTDLEAVSKFLDTAGSKLDYRRYGEALFDILIAGGLLGVYLLIVPSVCVHTCAGCTIWLFTYVTLSFTSSARRLHCCGG